VFAPGKSSVEVQPEIPESFLGKLYVVYMDRSPVTLRYQHSDGYGKATDAVVEGRFSNMRVQTSRHWNGVGVLSNWMAKQFCTVLRCPFVMKMFPDILNFNLRLQIELPRTANDYQNMTTDG
jgi:hypothetical protein